MLKLATINEHLKPMLHNCGIAKAIPKSNALVLAAKRYMHVDKETK